MGIGSGLDVLDSQLCTHEKTPNAPENHPSKRSHLRLARGYADLPGRIGEFLEANLPLTTSGALPVSQIAEYRRSAALDAHVSGRRVDPSRHGHDVSLDQEPDLEGPRSTTSGAGDPRAILVTHNVADFPAILRNRRVRPRPPVRERSHSAPRIATSGGLDRPGRIVLRSGWYVQRLDVLAHV